MEFWGIEVKAGEPVKVDPLPGMVIHLSQACLGEAKGKGNDSALLNVKIGDQKLVLGLLSLDKFPQLSFDLVFEKEFELSHNWKHGSIHFCGYQTEIGGAGDEEDDFGDFDGSESDEEAVPQLVAPNGTVEKKVEEPAVAVAKSKALTKPESSDKSKVKLAVPKKDAGDKGSDDDDDDDDDSSDDIEGSDDSDEDEAMLDGEDSDDDEDSEDESDEETPKKPEVSKKRVNESAAKTPIPAKKPKSDASPKSDGKKVGGHTATPYPTKKTGKPQATPATTEKSKQQTPKSGNVSCKTCSKSFGSDKALESHTKAKHA